MLKSKLETESVDSLLTCGPSEHLMPDLLLPTQNKKIDGIKKNLQYKSRTTSVINHVYVCLHLYVYYNGSFINASFDLLI